MRIACIGDGRMGRAVAAVATERGHTITVLLGRDGNAGGVGISRRTLGEPDVAIEFTEPAAAAGNAVACVRAGIPVVVGTTGWQGALASVEAEVAAAGGALFHAANFSIGVHVFLATARRVAALQARLPGSGLAIHETHHAAKKDAPSGTALALAAAVRAESGAEVPITSTRVGSVPGEHTLILDATFEQLRLTHTARDRRVFAEGAVRAAEWLPGRRGTFTMRDLLQLEES